MNKVIDKGYRSSRFVSTIVKHPVYNVNVIVNYLKIPKKHRGTRRAQCLRPGTRLSCSVGLNHSQENKR